VKRVRIHTAGSGITRPRDGRKREKKVVSPADEAAAAADGERTPANETSGDGAT